MNVKQYCAATLMGLTILLAGIGDAQARDLEPHYVYKITTCAGDSNTCGSVEGANYDSPDAAYAAYVNDVNTHPHGDTTLLDLYPSPNTTYYNGKPTNYWWHYEHSDGVILNTGSVYAIAECGVNVQQITTQISGLSYRVSCVKPDETQQPDCDLCNPRNTPPAVGKPILPSTGVEQQTETDYLGGDANGLRLTRTYRSDRKGWVNNYQFFGIDYTAAPTGTLPVNACSRSIGQVTGKSYCFPYMATGQANDFAVQRGNGRMLNFGSAIDLSPSADINDRVTKLTDNAGAITGYSVYNAANESTEHYDTTGRLQTITARNGQIQILTYSDVTTPSAIAPTTGLLIRVTDHFGRQLNFSYDSQSRLIKMTDPAGGITIYAYDEASSVVLSGNQTVGNLTSVIYPDGKKRLYWYNEQDKTAGANLPFALTGIVDENGSRFATIKYDGSGKAVSTELAAGVQQYSVSYPQPAIQSTVTDPLGTIRTYNFQTLLGVVKSTGYTQPTGAGSGATSTTIAYDANGNVATSTDFNGTVTTYSYDLTRNLETSRVEASGTVQARTITTTWHSIYRLPLQLAEPKLLTTYAYDVSGNLLSKTVQATSDATGAQGLSPTLVGNARTWNYTYNTVGQILTATGPRADVADKTTYTYDGSGNLSTITNAIGQVTTLSNYNANGRVGLITDANGASSALTYSPRGWLTGKTVTANGTVETTSYSYDGVGQLTLVTLPNASTVSYAYDPAHRLTNIADSLGNSIAYTLDNMGNRISEQVKDPSGALARQTSRVVDALNRLQQITGAMQ